MKQLNPQSEPGRPSHSDTITVSVHFGAEHVAFDVAPTTTLADIKSRAMRELNIATDPNFDYVLLFEGEAIADETQTLTQLLGAHPRPRIELHLKKRPKGG